MPTTSRAFQDRSYADLHLEYFTDLALQLEETETEIKKHMGEERDELVLKRTQLRIALGIEKKSVSNLELGYDPLIDEWEADIAAGRIPDLDKKG